LDLKIDSQTVLDLFAEHPEGALLLEAIQSRLGLPRPLRPQLRRFLKDLVQEGVLLRSGRLFRLPAQPATIRGLYRGSYGGGGLVVPDDGGPAIQIRPQRAGGALDRDQVLVQLLGEKRNTTPFGTIVSILARERRLVAGTFERRKGVAWLLPDDPHLPDLLPVVPGAEGEAVSGQAVIAEPISEEGFTRVRVVEVLGEPGTAKVEEAKLVHLFGLHEDFSAAALAEAAALPAEPPAAGREEREDLAFVTIDPSDARDFDDALCLVPAPGGGYHLWVAIADVAAYVRPGSALDQEAASRGCSVYLPGRVVPMLPPRLSGDLCSLKPGERRLALVVELVFDAQGVRQGRRIFPAVIRSRARLTYEEVAAVLDGSPRSGEPAAEQDAQLRLLEELARLLYARRVAAGALDLELPEARAVYLPEVARVVDIARRQRTWAHRLVEEMMIAANCAVGEELTAREQPTLWRVHEPPDPEELRQLAALADALRPGSKPPAAGGPAPVPSLRALLRRFEATPLQELFSQRLLRTLKQARYRTEDIGHFGLGRSSGYLHFTSPIRRYPDLLVHRQLHGQAIPLPELDELANQCSARERAAMTAEQAGLALHAALLLEGRVGERFAGTVAGITRAGLFIQLDSPYVQGLLPLASLADDYYEVAELGHELVGRSRGRSYRLGDRIRVAIASASPARRQIDLRLA